MAKNIKKRKKIAAILFALGDEASSKILRHLNEQELQMLANEMANLETYSKDDLREFLNELLKEVSDQGLSISADPENIKNILSKAFGEEKAKELLGKIGGAFENKSFYSLSNVRPQMIADFIKNELPQTIAVILSHLEPTQAAEVLSNLPEDVQPEVVYRMATLESLSPEVIDELERALEEEVKSSGGMESHQVGGIDPVAELLNNVPKDVEEKVLSYLDEQNPELSEAIKNKMFVFEDLIFVDDRGIQTILKEVSNEDLLLALKTATDEIKEKIFKNMSSRAAEMIQEDLEAMGPVKLSDVIKAQQNIVKVAKRLEQEGKIIIAKGGGEGGEVVV